MPVFVGKFEICYVVLQPDSAESQVYSIVKPKYNIKPQIMKKAILTIGLFSLVMILTSFTTPETAAKLNSTTNVDLVGSGAAGGNPKLDLVGSGAAGGNPKLDLVGSGAAGGNPKLDLVGSGAAGGNPKLD
jgi:hypothetical protein